MKEIYIDVCDNLKYFMYLENLEGHNKNTKNKILKKIKHLIKVFKFKIYKKFSLINIINYNNKVIYVIYSKKQKIFNKKINKLAKLLKNNQIILSKQLINYYSKIDNNLIKKIIDENKKDKTIFSNNIVLSLKNILEIRNENIEENNIYLVANNICNNNLINILAKSSKCLNIITSKTKLFKQIEYEILRKYEIPIIVSNNKRKSLLRAKYIINLELNEEQLNEYYINRNAIILNVSNNYIKKINGFDGIIINNIKFKTKAQYNYIYNRFENYMNNEIEVEEINYYIGNNGIIQKKELKNN